MTKTHFIQLIMIRTLPKEEKVEAGIAYAEKLWAAMDSAGYGNPKEGKETEHVNHYSLIKHKDAFDKFWGAFNLKKDRNGAAKSWNKINPTEELAAKIIHAARREATIEHETSRKWAQGWLQERRFDDMSVPAPKVATLQKVDPMKAMEEQFGKAHPALFAKHKANLEGDSND